MSRTDMELVRMMEKEWLHTTKLTVSEVIGLSNNCMCCESSATVDHMCRYMWMSDKHFKSCRKEGLSKEDRKRKKMKRQYLQTCTGCTAIIFAFHMMNGGDLFPEEKINE